MSDYLYNINKRKTQTLTREACFLFFTCFELHMKSDYHVFQNFATKVSEHCSSCSLKQCQFLYVMYKALKHCVEWPGGESYSFNRAGIAVYTSNS